MFGIKYCFCLCGYSRGRCVRMFVSGPGLVSMSPCISMRVELFHV